MSNQKPTNETIDDVTECEHDFVVFNPDKFIEKEDDIIYVWSLCTECNHPIKHPLSQYESTQWIYSAYVNESLRGRFIQGRIGRDKNAKYKDEGYARPRHKQTL